METNQKFEKAIDVVLKHEGSYINNPSDKGGETKYGISKRSYPNVDIKNLTLEQAKEIYKRDFWDIGKFNDIKDGRISTKLFDLSVNMGLLQANKIMQRALRALGFNLKEDGIIGSATLGAINGSDSSKLIIAIRSEAAGFYRLLASKHAPQNVFLNGWLTRAYT